MNKTCTKCNSKLLHYELHDAYCCLVCNTWREGKCDDSDGCDFCDNRPDVPFSIEEHNLILSDIIRIGFDLLYQETDDILNN